MALVIEGGISVGGNVSIGDFNIISPTANLILFYDAGNSMSYSGSGIQFNPTYTGPNLNSYQQYSVLDLAGLTGGPWNSGQLAGTFPWTSQGVASYWTTNSADTSYIDSTYQQEAPTLNSTTYTLLSVVRPKDFTQGAIVGGDENIFFFNPTGGLNNGPALMASNTYSFPAVIDTTTAYELNTWYCVAVTYDANTQVMRLYTNGNLVATATGVASITHPSGLYWGTLEGDLWFTGDMAVSMAYERVLGAGEISQLSTVYLSRYIAPPATSSIVIAPPVNGPPIWTVPEGVTSISVVAVGAGGSGTADSYSAPGGDTFMLRNDNSIIGIPTTVTGTGSQIVVDSGSYPNIANVTADGTWVVTGSDIAGQVPAIDLVVESTSTGVNQWTVVLNKNITTTAGDTFDFYQAVVAAEGGYEIVNNYYSSNPDLTSGWGPGPRALPLVTDGPYGLGGVVDWTDSWPIGGGGAGGYGIAGLAWNINQAGEWYYFENNPYHTMSFTNDNLTVSGLVDANTAGIETTVVGTETVTAGARVMYSVNISQTSGLAGYCGVGLSTYNQSLWNYTGSVGNNSVGYYDDGQVYINGGTEATYSGFGSGSVVDIAVDVDAGQAWFRVDGGVWNNNVSADPAANVGGLDISAVTTLGLPLSISASPYYNSGTATGDIISIATNSTHSVPAGYTFVPGTAGAGGNGGDGAADYGYTAMPGTGGSSGGGGSRTFDSGAGGGGTGLYGRGTSGAAGTWVNTNTNETGIALGGGGGSSNGITANPGGQATPWNGGRGGWPGGAGASATGYWDGGNGGALAYKNNYTVTPGEQYIVWPGIGGVGQNDGGSGADGAVRIVWPGTTRQFPTTLVGPDTVAVPTLDITGNTLGQYTGTVNWNIASDGGGTILETGIIWGLPGQDTYTNSVDICDATSSTAERKAIRAADSCSNPYTTGLTGAQTLDFQPSYQFYNETVNVRVYARNDAGVAYSPTVLTWTPTICLAEGTLVTLADGSTKAIESITMSDSIKVWDFDNSQYASATPLWIKQKQSTTQYNLIQFSDGSELKTISQHRIFNKEAGAFTYPMTDATPVGTTTVKADGSEVTVTSKKVVYEQVNYYNVITSGGYMNLYANTILTSLRYNNIYPIANMQFSKDSRALRSRAEFAGIADRWIDGLRLQEQTTALAEIKKYVERLEKNEAKTASSSTPPSWHK